MVFIVTLPKYTQQTKPIHKPPKTWEYKGIYLPCVYEKI